MSPPRAHADKPRRPAVGTLAWTRQTRGILSRRDRIAFLGQACIYGLAMLPEEIRRALGIQRRRLAMIDPAALDPPDSRAAGEAAELIEETAPAMVASHVHRTYAFGVILGAHDRLAFDSEVVYVASMLHDLYFADPQALSAAHCFTLPAADRAESLLADAGWAQNRRDLAAEAITLHLNLRPPRNSAEAYLVYAGARLDVSGYRYGDVRPETLASVLHRHPRLALKQESGPMFDAQAAANPGSRAAFLTRYLGVKWFTQHAPFAE
jgi:hypothetical protein